LSAPQVEEGNLVVIRCDTSASDCLLQEGKRKIEIWEGTDLCFEESSLEAASTHGIHCGAVLFEDYPCSFRDLRFSPRAVSSLPGPITAIQRSDVCVEFLIARVPSSLVDVRWNRSVATVSVPCRTT
jgi:hypothetical protein